MPAIAPGGERIRRPRRREHSTERDMDQNPYQAPSKSEKPLTTSDERRLTTPFGCLLAIMTGLLLGSLILWVIGVLRNVAP